MHTDEEHPAAPAAVMLQYQQQLNSGSLSVFICVHLWFRFFAVAECKEGG